MNTHASFLLPLFCSMLALAACSSEEEPSPEGSAGTSAGSSSAGAGGSDAGAGGNTAGAGGSDAGAGGSNAGSGGSDAGSGGSDAGAGGSDPGGAGGNTAGAGGNAAGAGGNTAGAGGSNAGAGGNTAGAGGSAGSGGSDAGAGGSEGGSAGAGGSGAGAGGGAGDEVPATQEALFAYLQSGAYKSFPQESKIHPSTGPHGGNVRTYLNAPLFASFQAGNSSHPKGSAVVKELYGSGSEVTGWAVAVKTAEESQGGAGWYWYEVFSTTSGSNPVAAAQGPNFCSNCHGNGGVDYVLTPFPLQ